ncbi:MAG: hypothetical protein GY698_14210 [Actinomycetia bacterium]|nr:hypothetical protein [Actinomycetes bacterium]
MPADVHALGAQGCPNELLAGVVDGSSDFEPADQDHVARCLRCQAELAQYRKLGRALSGLRARTLDPDPALVAEILDRIDGNPTHQGDRWAGRRGAYIGGIAAAAAAGAAGAIVYRVRRVG